MSAWINIKIYKSSQSHIEICKWAQINIKIYRLGQASSFQSDWQHSHWKIPRVVREKGATSERKQVFGGAVDVVWETLMLQPKKVQGHTDKNKDL